MFGWKADLRGGFIDWSAADGRITNSLHYKKNGKSTKNGLKMSFGARGIESIWKI